MSQKICFTKEDGKAKNWVDRYEDDPRYLTNIDTQAA